MAAVREAFLGLSLICVLLALSGCLAGGEASNIRVITTENFDDVSEGEWMLELYVLHFQGPHVRFFPFVASYAPWCPACKQFAKTWESFAEWTVDKGNGVKVGKVDVTAESGSYAVTPL